MALHVRLDLPAGRPENPQPSEWWRVTGGDLPTPLLVRFAFTSDGDDMTSDQRKRLLGTIFEEITVSAHGASELAPREGWRPYMKATLTAPRVLSERKTGLEGVAFTPPRLELLDNGRVGLLRAA